MGMGINPMDASREIWFGHEKLEVYREGIAFVAWLSALLEAMGRLGDIKDQVRYRGHIEPAEHAEGNAKCAAKDRCRFFDIAHGSALECAARLDVLVAKAKLTPDQFAQERRISKESSKCSWD